MELTYSQEFHINDAASDRFGRLKPSMLLYYIQEVAGIHGSSLGASYEVLASKNLFWAILRTKVQISRLPRNGETIRLETWAMPTTRVAYPRSVVAYDAAGHEIFRAISLWVLMDRSSRAMVLPGKSGVSVQGLLTGSELKAPGSLVPHPMENSSSRTVRFTDLDVNGHMNNTRYFDWMYDILPSEFHREHAMKELTICYLAEAREGQTLDMHWEIGEDAVFHVDAHRKNEDGADHRVFAARVAFE